MALSIDELSALYGTFALRDCQPLQNLTTSSDVSLFAKTKAKI